MSDDLPGWTCPDIDEAILALWRARGRPLRNYEAKSACDALDRVREANTKLRERCAELLQASKP